MYNYYKLLDIPFGSNFEIVKNASNKMLAQWYATPQKQSTINELEIAIQQAIVILSDPYKKEVYDLALLQIELQLSQNEAYRKYGISSRNAFIANPHKAPSKTFVKPPIPKLKKNIWMWLSFFCAAWLLIVFIYFTQHTGGVLMLLFFAIIALLVINFNVCKSIYHYVEVRQILHTKLTARRAVVLAINFFFLVFPVLSIVGFSRINKMALSEQNTHVYAQIEELYGTFANITYSYNGRKYQSSLKYNEFYNYDNLKNKKNTLKLPVHIINEVPIINHWCGNYNFFIKANTK